MTRKTRFSFFNNGAGLQCFTPDREFVSMLVEPYSPELADKLHLSTGLFSSKIGLPNVTNIPDRQFLIRNVLPQRIYGFWIL